MRSPSISERHRISAPRLPLLIARHRELLYELSRREILDRYANQILGGVWAIAHPLSLMLLYVFLFTVVFPDRSASEAGRPFQSAAFVLSGLIPWMASSEVLNRAPTILQSHGALVKQIAFPVEVLPLKSLAPALFSLAIFLALLIVGQLTVGQLTVVGIVLLPAALVLHLATLIGLSFLITAAGPFFRDLREILVVLTSAGLFLSPVLYGPARFETLPAALKFIIFVNPFSHVIWCYQDALYFGTLQHPGSWVLTAVFAAVTLLGGVAVFEKLKPMFGDAL
jgi:lipopolysaccharide transport system permease protein